MRTHVAPSGSLPLPLPTHHGWFTPPLAVATVARDTTAPHAASRRDRSAPPPSPVCTGATPWPSHSHWWLRGSAVAGAGSHGGRQNCDRLGTAPTDPASPIRPDTAY